MIRRLLISAALAASTVGVAHARHYVYSTTEGVSFAAVDMGSIKVSGSYREAWTTFYSKSSETSQIVSVRTLYQFDCVRMATREIQLVIYTSDGDAHVEKGNNIFLLHCSRNKIFCSF